MGRFGEPDQVDRLANLIWAVGQVLPKSRRSDYETCVVVFAAYLMGLCMPLAHWLLSDADLLGDSWEVGVVVAVFPVVMVLA